VLDRAGRDDPYGYDVIIDVVLGPDLPAFLDRLNPNGRMVAVGMMGGSPPADFGLRLLAEFRRSLSFATFSADTVSWAQRREAIAGLFAAASRAELRAVVHQELPLDQAVLAHQKLDAGQVFGRIVLVPGGARH